MGSSSCSDTFCIFCIWTQRWSSLEHVQPLSHCYRIWWADPSLNNEGLHCSILKPIESDSHFSVFPLSSLNFLHPLNSLSASALSPTSSNFTCEKTSRNILMTCSLVWCHHLAEQRMTGCYHDEWHQPWNDSFYNTRCFIGNDGTVLFLVPSLWKWANCLYLCLSSAATSVIVCGVAKS